MRNQIYKIRSFSIRRLFFRWFFPFFSFLSANFLAFSYDSINALFLKSIWFHFLSFCSLRHSFAQQTPEAHYNFSSQFLMCRPSGNFHKFIGLNIVNINISPSKLLLVVYTSIIVLFTSKNDQLPAWNFLIDFLWGKCKISTNH